LKIRDVVDFVSSLLTQGSACPRTPPPHLFQLFLLVQAVQNALNEFSTFETVLVLQLLRALK
jgi:hypothetical protein